ncbi:hypothetical protein EVB99_024 [Rhizobium phage RHph_N3_19]|nr:hypothetical protein EVB99_024 [Rhizobium phage RHph_N3_19]
MENCNPWKCLYGGYVHLKLGQNYYPTEVTNYYLQIYVEGVGQIWYMKERFEEVSSFQYNPDQVGDRDDDI